MNRNPAPLPLCGIHDGHAVEIDARFVHEIPRLFVRSWRDDARSDCPIELDSAELIDAACRRAEFYVDRGRTVASLEEFDALRKEDANVDAMFVCLLFVPEFTPHIPSGFVLFRRTWAHNIYLEFLAARPCISGKRVQLAGIGLAGLSQTFNTAIQIEAKEVWMETTELSAHYYSSIFALKQPATDHLILPVKKSFRTLKTRLTSTHG